MLFWVIILIGFLIFLFCVFSFFFCVIIILFILYFDISLLICNSDFVVEIVIVI